MLRLLFLAVILLSGCSSIDKVNNVAQKTNTTLLAGKGDTILKVDRYRNLENAFGKADVFGRKTNEGFTEVRFIGTQEDGTLLLARKDVTVVTNETTMSRTPFSTSNTTSQTSIDGEAYKTGTGVSFEANVQSTSRSTTMTPMEDYHAMMPPEFLPIVVKPDESILPLTGYIIEIIERNPNSIKYKITKNQ